MTPRLAIELDDSSHNDDRSRQRDAIKDRALREALIPILRIAWKRRYNTRQLQEQIRVALSKR
jgi:very-short-patch-repair endonuclease